MCACVFHLQIQKVPGWLEAFDPLGAQNSIAKHTETRSLSGSLSLAAPPPLTVRPKLELQKLVPKLALVPDVVAQVEITTHRHFYPR